MSRSGPSDEEPFAVPVGWHRHIEVRRHGGRLRPTAVIDPDAAEIVRLLVPKKVLFERLATLVPPASTAERALRTAIKARLAGDANPVGAAALLTIAVARLTDPRALPYFADALVDTDGLVFAARTVAELNSFATVSWQRGRGQPAGFRLYPGPSDNALGSYAAISLRIRELLASAPEDVYAAATRALAEYHAPIQSRVIASYLVPTRQDWAQELCTFPTPRTTLLSAMLRSAGSIGQVIPILSTSGRKRLAEGASISTDLIDPDQAAHLLDRPNVLLTLVDGIGRDLIPVLVRRLESTRSSPQEGLVLDILVELDAEESIRVLLPRLTEPKAPDRIRRALARAPAEGLRGLITAVASSGNLSGSLAERLTREHVARYPNLVADPDSGLSTEDRRWVNRVIAIPVASERVSMADVEIAGPRRITEVASGARITGLKPFGVARMVWLPGEQAEWARSAQRPGGAHWRKFVDWSEVITAFESGKLLPIEQFAMFAEAPVESTTELLANWQVPAIASHRRWLRPILARHGLAALALILPEAMRKPARVAPVLYPVVHPEVAALMAYWLRKPATRWISVDWLGRHPTAAADLLIPSALGGPPGEAKAARTALRQVAEITGPATVLTVAGRHGADIERAVRGLLHTEPVRGRAPRSLQWTSVDLLPQILLRDRSMLLSATQTKDIIELLATASSMADPQLVALRAGCDPKSLIEFGWALFAHWYRDERIARAGFWVLPALARLGGDAVTPALVELVRHWDSPSRRSMACQAIDVLVELGTGEAVGSLWYIGNQARLEVIRRHALDRLAALCARRGASVQQLVERSHPDLGFARDGTRTLDVACRGTVVTVDHRLALSVRVDGGGTDIVEPPKQQSRWRGSLGRSPDPAADSEPQTRLASRLSRQADEGLLLLELALRQGRRWGAADFRRSWLEHPLLSRLSEGLVWAAEHPDGSRVGFRVAEDSSLADVDDETFVLDPSADVLLPHPLGLAAESTRWSTLLADYEIVQPIRQLGRDTGASPGSASVAELLAEVDITSPVQGSDLIRLHSLGWRSGDFEESGRALSLSHPVASDRTVVISLRNSFEIGEVHLRYRIRRIGLVGPPDQPWLDVESTSTAELDAVSWSIVVEDLHWLLG
ncbi:DUF4132 domain-containing protein [Actinoalloteichus hymeniacidonis]|uniref:DUF4132 family protein n=1 Tax=Actinoalloteichus hymeniacidonis TaxID=340345 RepID=A0AAC9HND5_9PSEU|nr:DUF4132 domain-containing protein [Actinoalloteichus hymeniacidonis]AOS62562.1 putative DUF4132 family protein [Actinoalloteichus hymeniacidonis]MBB5909407.1 hypothetical protein [Actinoalloteichus hymeniacidonis]